MDRNLRSRPITFVAASQPATTTLRTVPKSENKPKVSHAEATRTCTLCSCTMSLKDFQAHSIGRRHQLALSKVDTNLEKLPSSSHTTPAGVGGKNIQRGGLVRSGQPAPTAMHPASLDVHASATPPVSSRASETVKQSTSSTSSTKTVKQMTNKAKKSTKVKRPKKERESIATPTASARLKILGLNDEYLGDRQDNSNPNHSMCGQECGWCGQYMNHLTDAITAFDPFSARSGAAAIKTSITPKERDPLEDFFALYAPFQYNRRASSHEEFKRLCAFFAWPPHYIEPNHEERGEAWHSFRIAMVKAFNMTFGQDENDIEAWGRMCVLVDMEDIPVGLEARKLAMINTHVNLSDLLDTTRQATRVHVFASEEELREYTQMTRRLFPKEDAYAGGLLKYLLRQISGPGTYHGSRGKK